MTYQVDISSDGKLLLPAELASALGLSAGDRLTVDADGRTLKVRRFVDPVDEVQERFRALLPEGFSGSLVDELIADRRAEAARE